MWAVTVSYILIYFEKNIYFLTDIYGNGLK
jgi:hypothetical protein